MFVSMQSCNSVLTECLSLCVRQAVEMLMQVVDLWKHVNPGVMEKYVGMPGSTMSDHFKWLPEQQESLNRIHHFKKTDFSEYNEVAARSMKTLITNKGSA